MNHNRHLGGKESGEQERMQLCVTLSVCVILGLKRTAGRRCKRREAAVGEDSMPKWLICDRKMSRQVR